MCAVGAFNLGPRVERETLDIAYDGPALAAGTMDARELGPVLVSVSDLCLRANRLINGNAADLKVNVQARFRRGSFEVPVEVVQTIAATLLSSEIKDVHYVLVTLGLFESRTAVDVGASLWKFAKWAYGKVIVAKTPQPNGLLSVVAGDNSTIIINQHVDALASDPVARRALTGIVRPLENSGVESVVVKSGDQIVQSATRDDVPALEAPIVSQPLTEIPLPEEVRIAAVQVIRAAFQNNMAWDFSEGGQAHFPAVIEDEAFLERVSRHELRFGAGDVLRVRLVTRKFQTLTGLRSDVRVVEVLDTISAPRQTELPL